MKRTQRRRLGQHFLEAAWVEKVLRVIAPEPGDAFLEIGPGRGALTRPLASRCAHVTAVEIDPTLAHRLRADGGDRVSVVTGDVLTLDLGQLGLVTRSRAVGNLPYRVASQILLKLLHFADGGRRLSDATLMLQREVADRVVGQPGSGDWGPLAIATRMAATPTRVLTLPPGAFRPIPKVRSAVVHLRFHPAPVAVRDRQAFDALVRQIFTQRRKTAVNALRPFAERHGRVDVSEVFVQAGVDPRHRPGQLDLVELAELSAVLGQASR